MSVYIVPMCVHLLASSWEMVFEWVLGDSCPDATGWVS